MAHTRNYFTCQKANEDILTTKTDYKASNEQRIRVIFYCQLGILSRFNYHACNDRDFSGHILALKVLI